MLFLSFLNLVTRRNFPLRLHLKRSNITFSSLLCHGLAQPGGVRSFLSCWPVSARAAARAAPPDGSNYQAIFPASSSSAVWPGLTLLTISWKKLQFSFTVLCNQSMDLAQE